ncbi:MAG TPA: hypothetical protein VIO64_06885 [Pseudobacteroides sp.]|uniref:hypothetical protein n=1 Tax=Pseudobacteroides sp. TaxID=1968840 RepID=UPI002F922770
MDRQVLTTVLDILDVKKSYAAKVIGVNNSTFSLKLKNYKMRYRLFDDEITLLIEKIFKESLFIKENDESVKVIRKTAKAKQIAEALINLMQADQKKYDSSLPTLTDDNYPEYIISLIWLEQVKNNDMYALKKLSKANKDKGAVKDIVKEADKHVHDEYSHNFMACDNIFSREIIPKTQIDIKNLIEDNYILTSIIKRLLNEMASDSFSTYTPLN